MALLEILAASVDQQTALDAAAALVELHRELLSRYPDSPEALRDLSISLNDVGEIQESRGLLDDALAAYTESLQLRQRIRTDYGDTPQTLRDLKFSEENIARLQEQLGHPGDAS